MSSKETLITNVLSELNEAQKRAVTASQWGQLQVIAGPGTGKTKVLTSKVAYLILKHKIEPSHIIVTTFTKKAAEEMKNRLALMMRGSGVDLNQLNIGTFHSICFKLLKRFGHLIDRKDFRVCSERDKNAVLRSIFSEFKDELEELNRTPRDDREMLNFDKNGSDKTSFNEKTVGNLISRLKSEGVTPIDYQNNPRHNLCLSRIYEEYGNKFKLQKLLDFDDLLLYGNLLLKSHKCYTTIEHVLIDEFQDTNTIQLQLMREFGKQNSAQKENITTVGDPDQSIYGFRNAVSDNFDIMKQAYSHCRVVKLTENYRSTSDVLNFSESIMVPQKNREPRILKSNLDSTFKPVYVCCVSPDMEADYIAEEIAYLKSLPHNLYRYSDFVIIIRVGHVTRSLEKGLMRRRIPYRVVKGKAFWEKDEVTLMVDFLRVFAYANDIQAITRVVTGCTEGIGPSRKQKLIEFFELKLKQGIFPLEALIGYIDGTYKGLTLTAKSKKSLETLLLQLNRLYEIYNRDSDDKIVVLELFDKIKTLDVFQQLFQDKEGSSENVGEVRSYLSEFVPELEVADTNDHVPAELEPEPLLSKFLQSIDLFLQHNNDATDKLTDQRVSISTIHAAKGLEWPVVFAPCLANGILPVGKDFSEESPEEERRVLYVATTRAKHLLYLSFAPRSFSFGANESSFLTSEVKAGTSDFQTAMSTTESLETLYKIRGIEPPKNTSLQLHVSKYKLLSSSRESEGISGETAGPQPKGIDMIGAVHVAIFPTRNLSLPPVPNFAPKLFAPSASTISSGVNSERVVLAPGIVKAKNSETKRRKTLGVRRR